MKATIYTSLFLSLTLLNLTPSFAYTYYQYPPTDTLQGSFFPATTPDPHNVEEAIEQSLEQQQETADQYLNSLLETLNTYGAPKNVQDAAEQQVEQVQETYEQAGEYVQDVFDTLINAIYGSENDTEDNVQENQNVMSTTASPQEEDDEDEAGSYATTVSFVVSTEAGEDDNDDEVITTPAPVITTAAANNEEESDDEEGTTTVAPVSTANGDDENKDEDDDDDDDEDETTTPVSINRTLSTIQVDDNDNDDDDDDDVTTMATAMTAAAATTDDDNNDDDDAITMAPTMTPAATTAGSTAPAAPIPITTVPNPCKFCDFKHGVGYVPHASDCTLFIQCRMGADGVPEVAGVQSCPHGLYWNQKALICDLPSNVQCVDDICRSDKKQLKRAGATCRGFWSCRSGTAVAKCCPPNFAYNPVTERCHFEPSCQDECLSNHTSVSFECNGMRSVPEDRNKYKVQIADGTWKIMSCPPTLAFIEFPCGCSVPLNQAPQEQMCAPQLYLPFTKDTRDYSGLQVWVENKGVRIIYGKAYFDGTSSLIVPFFANNWWGDTVYIHIRYRSDSDGSGLRHALVSNGDCSVLPSLSMCAGPQGVDFYAKTEGNALPVNFNVSYGSSEDGWKDVFYQLDGGHLAGFVNKQMTVAPAKGALKVRPYGLVIGSGVPGCNDFKGFIDELTVYRCRPEYNNLPVS